MVLLGPFQEQCPPWGSNAAKWTVSQNTETSKTVNKGRIGPHCRSVLSGRSLDTFSTLTVLHVPVVQDGTGPWGTWGGGVMVVGGGNGNGYRCRYGYRAMFTLGRTKEEPEEEPGKNRWKNHGRTKEEPRKN